MDKSNIYYQIEHIGFTGNLPKVITECPASLTGKGGKPLMRNCFDKGIGYRNQDLFYTDFRYNYALWFSLITMNLFFILTLMSEP